VTRNDQFGWRHCQRARVQANRYDSDNLREKST